MMVGGHSLRKSLSEDTINWVKMLLEDSSLLKPRALLTRNSDELMALS